MKRAPLKPSVLPAEGKHLAGHRFDFWRPTAAKEEMPWPGARRRNVGVVSTEDSDAVLELHYAEETRESRPYVEETRESRPYVEETRESRPYVEETRESRSHYGDADTQKVQNTYPHSSHYGLSLSSRCLFHRRPVVS